MTGRRAKDDKAPSTAEEGGSRKRPRLPRAAKADREIINEEGFTFKRKKRPSHKPPDPPKPQEEEAQLISHTQEKDATEEERPPPPTLPPLPPMPHPQPSFSESLTTEGGEKRFMQLCRRICRAEVAHVGEQFPNHPYLAAAAEAALRAWVRDIAPLVRQHGMAPPDPPPVLDLAPPPVLTGEQGLAQRKAKLQTLKTTFETEEAQWEALKQMHADTLSSGSDIPPPPAAMPASPPSGTGEEGAPAIAAVLGGAWSDSQRKLAFQAEALSNLVESVEDVCARAESACALLAQDFHCQALGPLLQTTGSPKDLLRGLVT